MLRGREFPSLNESARFNGNRKGARNRGGKSVTLNRVPFESSSPNSVLLKGAPIELRWQSRYGCNGEDEARHRAKLNGGQKWNSRWFRSPPKVRVVPGILGPSPTQVTRVANRGNGEDDGGDDQDSDHPPAHLYFESGRRHSFILPQITSHAVF